MNPPRAPLHPDPDAAARARGFNRIAGIDEAGRGPWAGPVVASAVILKRRKLPVRIDDSKRLTPRHRACAFAVILRHAEVGFGIVCAKEIDRLNILQASLLAMTKAVEDLPSAAEFALVDGTIPPVLSIPCWTIIEGDRKSYLIGCASIMAKVLRDELMAFYHQLAPDYGFLSHKGYGTPEHIACLSRQGPSFFHRRGFRPIAECIEKRLTANVPAS
ncbi:MAG: ribonuclease HII [Candidatus Omnitrophica bacterium]|nr:ribonuclease HII [Candidatus Omnitrophota bacterium]